MNILVRIVNGRKMGHDHNVNIIMFDYRQKGNQLDMNF